MANHYTAMSKSSREVGRISQQKDELNPAIGLTDKEVLSIASSTVGEHLTLSLEGKEYQSEEIWHLLLWASAKRSSVEDACEQLLSFSW